MASNPRGTMHEQKDTFQYIPLSTGLQALLKNREICNEVRNKWSLICDLTIRACMYTCTQVFQGHMRSDDYLSDFCDGSLFKNHPLFQTYPDALQLIIYFDELEVCNPLASHSGIHKLGKETLQPVICGLWLHLNMFDLILIPIQVCSTTHWEIYDLNFAQHSDQFS